MQTIWIKHIGKEWNFLNKNKILKINGTTLDQEQLKNHLEKIATNHNLVNKSQKNTYPIPYLEENFKIIEEVYNILNEHLKLGISIHPAGEWLLDNFYIIEETVKQIKKRIPKRNPPKKTPFNPNG